MLASTSTIEAVAQAIHDNKLKTLVVDPVGSCLAVLFVCLHGLTPILVSKVPQCTILYSLLHPPLCLKGRFVPFYHAPLQCHQYILTHSRR